MKHKHADKMLQYAKDAMATEQPWLLWQTRFSTEVTVIATKWRALMTHPIWATNAEYRKLVSEAAMDAFIANYLKTLPKQVPKIEQTALLKELRRLTPISEDWGQFCGSFQTYKYLNKIYIVELDPDNLLLNIAYK